MPSQSKWAIRFFSPYDTEDTSLSFVGSFDNADGRHHDDVVVFSGMYGVPDFMLWYVHQDMESYDFSKYSIDLRLYLIGDRDVVYHQDQYRFVSIKDDPNSSRKIIYAVQSEYALLKVLFFDANIYSFPYDETRGPIELLREVLTKHGVMPVVFMEHFEEDKKTFLYEYPTFAFEPDWTVYDFVNYVCTENALEWTIKNGILYVGPELWTYEEINATDPISASEVKKIVKTPFVTKLYSAGAPLDVLYYYEFKEGQNMTPLRCVWVKHEVGAGGDKTTGCFVPIGQKCSKELFVESLEGDKEIGKAYYTFSKRRLFKQIKVGAVVADESDDGYDERFIDKITYEKDFDNWAKKTPRRRILNITDPSYILHKIGRTTPYLGDGEGMQFPVPDTPANFIALMPDDRIENTVQGPFVFGNGDTEFVIPIKESKDLRLKLGDKAELYYSHEHGLWHLQSPHGFVFKNTVTESDDKPIFGLLANDGTRVYLKDDGFQVEGPTTLFQLEPCGCMHLIPTTDDVGNPGLGKYQINAWNDLGQLDFFADNEINIKISKTGGEIDIAIGPNGNYPGTININCAGTVNVGANATMVNLAGGSNFLALDTHTHQVPVGPAIPGPPSQAVPTGGITTKTKAT